MFTQFKRENTLQKHFKSSRDAARPRIDLADESQNKWSWFKVVSWVMVDTVALGLLYTVRGLSPITSINVVPINYIVPRCSFEPNPECGWPTPFVVEARLSF